MANARTSAILPLPPATTTGMPFSVSAATVCNEYSPPSSSTPTTNPFNPAIMMVKMKSTATKVHQD